MRRWLLSLALCALPAVAQEDPAALMPADTMVYAEVDAAALEKGLPELGLVRMLTDPRLRPFFQPTFDRLGLDAENPVATLQARLPVKQWLAGKAAVGIRGMTIRVKLAKGEPFLVRISASEPVDARVVYRVLDLYVRALWGEGIKFDDFEEIATDFDMLAVVEPGPLLKALVETYLNDPKGIVSERRELKIGDKDVEHFTLDSGYIDTLEVPTELFVHRGPSRWMIATRQERLAEALAGGPRRSLANGARFPAVRARMGGGHRLAFGYTDLAPLAQAFGKLVPPLVGEMNELNGLASFRGLGFGLSLTEGGVRESVGLLLDGDPKGVWRLLDAFPGGLKSLSWAPPGALVAAGLKFDARMLVKRWRELAADILPRNEGLLEWGLDEAFKEIGYDFRNSILPALGDEIAVFAFPPAMGGMIPDIVVGVDFADEGTFRKLVERIKAQVAAEGGARFEPVQVTEQIEGFKVHAQLPMLLTFAVAKGHLFGASSPDLLRKVLTEWGAAGAPTLLKDGPVFEQTLRGLNGGNNENLVALAYLNLRKTLPLAYPMLLPAGVQLPKEWVDVTTVPDLQRLSSHVSGAAIGLRRDGDGITLDTYSPAGLLVPMTVLGMYVTTVDQRQVVARAPVVPQPAGKASLGINVMSSDGTGVTVLGFFETSAARDAGLKTNDKIVAINEAPIKTIEDLRARLARYQVGEEVKVTTTRGEFSVTLGRMIGG